MVRAPANVGLNLLTFKNRRANRSVLQECRADLCYARAPTPDFEGIMSIRIGTTRSAAPAAPVAPTGPTAAELKLANAFVRRNAGGDSGRPGDKKLFPAIDAGESGLMGAVLTG